MYSTVHKGYRCVYLFFTLVLDKPCLGESLGSFLLCLLLYVFCAFNFSGAKTSCLLSKGVFLVIRASGHCWANLVKGKIGKIHPLVHKLRK
jgi:hypothetical protein